MAVWRFSQAEGIVSEPSMQWPGIGGASSSYSGANFQIGQGAVWSPWGDRLGREVLVAPAMGTQLRDQRQSTRASCVVLLDAVRWELS